MTPSRPSLFSPSTLVGKLLWSILPLVLISMCAVVICCYYVAAAQIRGGIAGQVQGLAEQVATHVEAFHEQRRLDLEAIAESRNLFDYHRYLDLDQQIPILRADGSRAPDVFAREAQDERDKLGEYFLDFHRRVGVYDLVAYCDPSGRIVAAVEGAKLLRLEQHPDLPAASLIEWTSHNRLYTSPILEQHGRKHVIFAKGFTGGDGVLRGVIVLVCNMEKVLPALEQTRVGQRGYAYIRDDLSGQTIGHAPQNPSPLRAEISLKGLKRRVVVEASEEEFLGPLGSLRNATILLSVLVTAGLTALLITVVRRASRPIHDMVDGTRRLATGDLSYRFPLPALRDLQNLATAFNDMAENLKTRSEALEDRVNQLSALRMMEHTVVQGLDEESILRTTLAAVAKGLGFDRAGLYWVDEANGRIVGRYSHFNYPSEFTEAAFRKRILPLGGNDILNQVITARAPKLVKDPTHQEGVDVRFVREARTGEFVMAPLCGQDHVYGVITADNWHTHRPLGESDRDGLMLFAAAAGMALENARLMGKVAESEARHRMVLENSPVAILGLSRDHRIVTWNRGAENIFGFTASEIVGQSLRHLMPGEAMDGFERLISELIRSGSVREWSLKGQKKSGQVLEMTVSWGGKHADFLANDEWAVVIRDVTEARKLQNQLILSEKLSVVGQLIAGIAHELNNPLQAVVGYAQLLSASVLASGRERELENLCQSAQRCRRIIDNLLLFVRHGDVKKKPVNLRKAVDASLELLSHKIRRTQIEVDVQSPEPQVFVNANFQQLEQVFINLINNACDSLRETPQPRRIQITLEPCNGTVYVRVSDTGPGIAPHVRQRIFEPFFTTKGEGVGTGLGLSLCRQIIQEHGGDLGLLDGPGAVFGFGLPICETPAEPAAGEPREPARTGGRKVFVVDDEPEVRGLLQDVLEAQGHEVSAAESLESALRLAGRERFDLVVSDVHLNDGTGLDLFRRWRQFVDYPRPVFLFLTGDIVSPSLEAVCTEMEARVLQKPMDLREFRAAVAWALSVNPRVALRSEPAPTT